MQNAKLSTFLDQNNNLIQNYQLSHHFFKMAPDGVGPPAGPVLNNDNVFFLKILSEINNFDQNFMDQTQLFKYGQWSCKIFEHFEDPGGSVWTLFQYKDYIIQVKDYHYKDKTVLPLTHWGQDKMVTIFLTTFSNEWKRMNFDFDFTQICSWGSN